MKIQLRGGYQTEDPRLDRIPFDDPRNQQYPVRALLEQIGAEPITQKVWSPGPVTDQGREGACVGHGCTLEATSSPSRLRVGTGYTKPHYKQTPDSFAFAVYKRAQKIDPWAGEEYSGTAVLAGVKILQSLGIVSEYRWAFSMQDIRDTLLYHGPVILGVNWYESMYSTRSSGLVEVSGSLVGGHCITLTGYDDSRRLLGESNTYEMYKWQNSWGSEYGRNGYGWIRAADLSRLVFDEHGEACVPVVRRLPGTYNQTLSV